MNFKKLRIFVLVIASLCIGGLLFFVNKNRQTTNESVIAIGLRGASAITKPLSPLQQQRLAQHFLDTPPVIPSHGNIRTNVQAINELNRRQSK